jgi:hypothetical protein
MSDQHYEMLWNCSACGVIGLLAKSQRHCPACGAAQDPALRYFPEPGKEVAVNGHTYVGADWPCGYCASPNGAAADFCANCGGPKAGAAGATVKMVNDAGQTAAAEKEDVPPTRKKVPWVMAIVGLLAAGAVALGFMFFQTHDKSVQILATTWERTIKTELFQAVHDSAWCSSLPVGAYDVRRTREVKEQKKVEAGQDCVEKRKDMGDGTFTKKQECSPRYRDEPVYADKCHFTINRWSTGRNVTAQGDHLTSPVWPEASLMRGAGAGSHGISADEAVLGAERLGPRTESFTVQMKSEAGDTWSCAVSEVAWQTFKPQQKRLVKVRSIGGPVCDTLH